MKVKELLDKIKKMRGGYEETERKLMEYRNREGGGITVAEVEARAGYQVCNCVMGFIEHLVYEQQVEP